MISFISAEILIMIIFPSNISFLKELSDVSPIDNFKTLFLEMFIIYEEGFKATLRNIYIEGPSKTLLHIQEHFQDLYYH